MPKRLQSSAVLVTGGAVRIGRAICEVFSEAGFGVVIHYRESGASARALASEIRSSGGEAWAVGGRLDTEAGCRKVMADAWRVSGGLSVLVNNAAIYEIAGASESSWALYERIFKTNLFGPACLAVEFRKRVGRAKAQLPCVVNILDRRIAGIDPETTAYTLSKKALADYTRMTALEFAPSVRVNAVAPGAVLPAKGRGVKKAKVVLTDNPLKTQSFPEDVAEAVLYLAESPSTTGQIIYIDGGKHLEG